MDPQDAKSLFTTTSLLSLQGATIACLIVPNTLKFLIPPIPTWVTKWISFILALGLSFLVAQYSTETGSLKWVVAFFNGFLIFSSAMGINQAAARGTDLQSRSFFSSWLKG